MKTSLRLPLISVLAVIFYIAGCKSTPPPGTRAPTNGYALEGGSSFGKAQASPKKPEFKTWERSSLPDFSTRLKSGAYEEIPLDSMSISVRVDGYRARIVADYFYIPKGSFQEGDFKLKLPEGATPYYLAFGIQNQFMDTVLLKKVLGTSETDQGVEPRLDIPAIRAGRERQWGEVKEARIQPAADAAYAYESMTRPSARRDPALMEWAGPDIFTCRVFPLRAQIQNRIVVAFDVNLVEAGENRELVIPIPEEIKSKCTATAFCNPADKQAYSVSGLEAKDAKSGHYAADSIPNGNIRILAQKTGNTLLTGTYGFNESYFAASIYPDLPEKSAEDLPEKAVFLLDISLSSRPDRFGIYLNLLQEILKNNESSLKEFAVMPFNVGQTWWQDGFAKNTAENRQKFSEYSKSLVLFGATDLANALLQATSPAWAGENRDESWNLFLLSDAASTWGEDRPQMLRNYLHPGQLDPVFSYKLGMGGTSTQTLYQLATLSGGAVFSVTGPDQVAEASRAHNFRPWYLVNAEMEGASDLLIAGGATHLYPGQEVLIAGRGRPEGKPKIRLELAKGRKIKKVNVKMDHLQESPMTGRAYGQIAVDRLESFHPFAKSDAVKYGMHYRIPGKSCSLVMLETDRDYQRFELAEDYLSQAVSTGSAQALVSSLGSRIPEFASDKQNLIHAVRGIEQTPSVKFQPDEALMKLIGDQEEDAFSWKPMATALDSGIFTKMNALGDLLEKEELPAKEILEVVQNWLDKNQGTDAILLESSLLEKTPDDIAVTVELGHLALQAGMPEHAAQLFRRAIYKRPYLPNVYLALAEVYEEMNKPAPAILLYDAVARAEWDGRLGNVQYQAMLGYLSLLRRIGRGEMAVPAGFKSWAQEKERALTAATGDKPADIVVVFHWNTDNTDVDLHVVEPGGRECSYLYPHTKTGGELTVDARMGYGPEVYRNNDGPGGRYKIHAFMFRRNTVRSSSLPTRVFVKTYTNWGRVNEKVENQSYVLKNHRLRQRLMHTRVKKTGGGEISAKL